MEDDHEASTADRRVLITPSMVPLSIKVNKQRPATLPDTLHFVHLHDMHI